MTIEPLDLGDHQLWPDGEITVSPSLLTDYIFKLSSRGVSLTKLKVTELTPEIRAYNSVSDHPIGVKQPVSKDLFPPNWVLPERYKYLDLDEYLIGLADKIERDSLHEKRIERLSHEIWLFKQLGLDDVLRVLIYVIETLRERKAVWGVGRGSSCSSYLLYLLGLHEVDVVKYDIDVTDFIKIGDRDAKKGEIS